MIYVNIENDEYDFNSPLFKCAIAFLKRPDLNMLEPGRIDLDNGVYASVQEYETKDENECRFETHEKYFDIQFVVSGKEYIGICDRKEAIAYAIEHGCPGDIIVVAGKGHEDYQEIRGVKYPMDDRQLVADILQERGNKN